LETPDPTIIGLHLVIRRRLVFVLQVWSVAFIALQFDEVWILW
jgi:hypothetical protein